MSHPLSIGTRVVTRAARTAGALGPGVPAGAVGVVLRAPYDLSHRYRVRFADGAEASYESDEIVPLRAFQDEAMAGAAPLEAHDLSRFVILRVIVGSRAYGLDHEASDTDRRGCYLPSAEQHWSLFGVPEQIEDEVQQEVYWELQKFLQLALKANPSVLECLWSPLIESATDLGRELIAMRRVFLSKLVFQTYSGYVTSQFRKLERDVRLREEAKPKHAMHLIRLLIAGTGLLEQGDLTVRAPDAELARLIEVRDGRVPWYALNAWRLELQARFATAFERTSLPDHPDYAAVNAFLLRARRSAVTS